MHIDRCEAVSRRLQDVSVAGLEYYVTSAVYDWDSTGLVSFKKITRNKDGRRSNALLALWLVIEVLKLRARHVFLCHYDQISTQFAAFVLRCLGRRVYLMVDSKFDDCPRFLWREILKSVWLKAYVGAIAGSDRTQQYLRFLGFNASNVSGGYDTLSLTRIRDLAGSPVAPGGVPFATRHLTIVARLVPKKNLFVAVEAFALYARAADKPRILRIFGDGPLGPALRAHAAALGVADLVIFEKFRQSADVCRALGSSLALLLVSKEEQFGFAVIEALAMGVPVIVGTNVGARDEFVRAGVNGFVVEPDNVEGIAWFIRRLCEDEGLWSSFAQASLAIAENADASRFAKAVGKLTGLA